MTGQIINGCYLVTDILTPGNFGQTYIAKNISLPGNPVCVVKQLKPKVNPSYYKIALRKFYEEAENLAKLGQHPQIPHLLDYFQENDQFYLVQEYIAGHTLRKEIEISRSISEEQVIKILLDLLEILKFVHANQVIHRDIKPANIIQREQDNKLVLIDFGAVKKIVSGEPRASTVIIGSPGYMPQEQRIGQPQYCSDIYAVGMVCIQALMGYPPSGMNILELPRNQGEIIWRDRVQISNGLGKILTKMIRYNYQERYSSAQEVIEEIENLRNYSKPINKTLLTFLLIGLSIIAAVVATFGALTFNRFKDISTTPISRIKLDGTEINKTFVSTDISNNPLDQTYSHRYIFVGQKGQVVNIEMKSEEVDPSLELLRADKSHLKDNDDISPTNFNSRITITLPKDGHYIVVASSSEVGELGSYRLSANILSE